MSNSGAPKVVLIADDQAFIRSLLVSMLRDLGYKTLEASDGNHAMQQLGLRPHAAILDHRMAGLTGLEILQAVRCGSTGSPRALPILMLTGNADEHIVRVAADLDVSALLSKPVSKVQMRARLDSACKMPTRLKPMAHYAGVNVLPAECNPTPQKTSNAWILRDTIFPREEPFAPHQRPPKQKGSSMSGEEMHYSRIEPGMVLSKDVHNTSGRLLLAAGTELSEDTVKRLRGICEDNPTLRYLSVQPARKAEIYAAVSGQDAKSR
ncbi:MAG: response regulator [Kiloniellaceae bacterium]